MIISFVGGVTFVALAVYSYTFAGGAFDFIALLLFFIHFGRHFQTYLANSVSQLLCEFKKKKFSL